MGLSYISIRSSLNIVTPRCRQLPLNEGFRHGILMCFLEGARLVDSLCATKADIIRRRIGGGFIAGGDAELKNRRRSW